MRRTLLTFLFLSGVAAYAAGQSLIIDHTGFGCVVAEKYPELTACITPRSRVARARVYFRGEGTQNWFYVPLTSSMPCYRAVLPKPKRDLHRFAYYLGATDTTFAETQTAEYQVEVVPDEASCRKGPLAPFLSNASVAVTSATGASALPTGFAVGGGGFPGIVLGVVGGGAALAGGLAGIGGGGGGGGGTPPSSLGPPTTTVAGNPPGSQPSSPHSTTPPPSASTTTVPGAPTTTMAGAPTTTLPGTTTTTLPVTTTTTLSVCAIDTKPPQVAMLYPTNGQALLLPSLVVSASASDATDGIAKVDFYYQESGRPSVFIGSSGGPSYSTLWLLPPCSAALLDTYTVSAVATDNCGNVASSSVRVTLLGLPLCLSSSAPAPPGTSWISELTVPGGRGQVVLNGTDAFFPGPGRSGASAAPRPGSNRVEALLVDGRGQGGTWRFELGGLGLEAESLRVLAGDVLLAGPDALVFRLSGRPGERIVFYFRRREAR